MLDVDPHRLENNAIRGEGGSSHKTGSSHNARQQIVNYGAIQIWSEQNIELEE